MTHTLDLSGNHHRAQTLQSLRQLCRGAVSLVPSDARPRLSTGIPALDRLLPGGGLECGSLVEWLVPVAGAGACSLALQGIRSALQQRPAWAVVDPTGEFHSPPLQGWGVPLESLLLLRPNSIADTAWTVEQCLRCTAVGVTWIQMETLPERVLQRWKIAAETGGGTGVLFRPAQAQQQASWADVRWLVEPRRHSSHSREAPEARSTRHTMEPVSVASGTTGRRLCVTLLTCRGPFSGGSVELDVNDATGDVRLVSTLAGAATAVRATGA